MDVTKLPPNDDGSSRQEAITVVICDRHGNECKIQYPAAKFANNYFVMGLHKAGSVLLNGIIDAICAETGNKTVPIAKFLFSEGLKGEDIPPSEIVKLDRHGHIYSDFRVAYIPERMPSYRTAKKLLLVRDPRDAAVSYFFSMRQSHPLPGGGAARSDFEAARRAYRTQDINSAILEGGLNNLLNNQKDFCCHRYLLENLTVYRYEDIVYRKADWLEELLGWLDVRISSRNKSDILDKFDVFPNVENPQNHIRQVSPGNYKNHLSSAAVDYIEAYCSRFFDTFDYPREVR